MKTKPEIGTRVRMTKTYLQSTGQYSGSECFRKWTVVACDCGLCLNGTHIATDEKSLYADEIPDMPTQRHINIGNLQAVK